MSGIDTESFIFDQTITVVGIDLTAGERRRTGWCLLAGSTASTSRLSTDDDIVDKTVAAKPSVVAIDSPLSLPRGRVSVFDDDPGRAEFGIYRECERALRRRGVPVYPTLIPSMQRLTERGIRLASTLRALGLTVIEVFPGGAQDVFGIGRKRAGREQLARGLAELGVATLPQPLKGNGVETYPRPLPKGKGVEGEFLERMVSHDELDAITAAVVGAFYVAGRFEVVGDVDEGVLIMPSVGNAIVDGSVE